MAVLHEHPAEVAELQGDGDAATRVQPVDVLASTFPGRDVGELAVAGEDLPLLEVDVDGVVPAAAAVLQGPDLAGAEARRRRDTAEVRSEHVAAVGLDAPGAEEAGDRIAGGLLGAAAELEGALRRHGDLRQVGVRTEHRGNLALVRTGRVAGDAELQEAADTGVVRLARQGIP
ncbi:hypothetical protein D9M71_672910 [compost metagenome]